MRIIGKMITMMTDFGVNDWYVACMKGMILKVNPKAIIIDVTHNCNRQDVRSAAYILKNSDYFPENTVHLTVVDPGVGSSRLPIVVKLSNSQVYVMPDNGIITLLLEKYQVLEAFVIENQEFTAGNISTTFHGRDIFAPVAAHASLGLPLSQFGRILPDSDIIKLNFAPLVFEHQRIIGEIAYIDVFGNLITNIHKENVFGDISKAEISGKTIEKVLQKYCDGGQNELILLYSSENFVEVAVNQGSAQSALSVCTGTQIILYF